MSDTKNEISLAKGLEIIRREMIIKAVQYEASSRNKAEDFCSDGDLSKLYESIKHVAVSEYLEKMSKTFSLSAIQDWKAEQDSRYLNNKVFGIKRKNKELK